MTCPICNGAGKRIVVRKHVILDIPVTHVEWCNCMKSKFISQAPNLKLLGWLGDTYATDINKELELTPELDKSPNIILKGTYETFCLQVKGFILNYWFKDNAPTFYACRSIELLQSFFVQQSDGTSPKLGDLDQYDLLIFMLGTVEHNSRLAGCVSQVTYNRRCIRKPTWIYLPKPLQQCQEYSSELEDTLKDYKTVALDGSADVTSVANLKAANFSR